MEALSKYVLGSHSNVIEGGLTSGHAWISLTHIDKKLTQTYGLWPDDHPRTRNNGKRADVRIVMELPKSVANRYYALTERQYKKTHNAY